MNNKESLKAFNSKGSLEGSFPVEFSRMLPLVRYLSYLRGSWGKWRRIERALHVALPFLPAAGQGYEWNSPPLSWLALLPLTPPPSPFSICSSFDLVVVGFDGLHVPFFALCFCHPDSATPFGSVTLLRLIRLCSFFFALFPLLTTSTTVSTFDHHPDFFALVKHPDFFRGPLRNQRLPLPAPRSITFIRNTPCRHATFRGQALPTTNLQGPFLHI